MASHAKRPKTEIVITRPPCEKCGQDHTGCSGHAGPDKDRPCKNPPIQGGFVCTKHGGQLPNVRRKANMRLMELVPSAVATLGKVLVDPKAKDSDKIRASVAILDRAGFSPAAERTVGDAREALYDLLMARKQARDEALAALEAAEQADDENIHDAEVVEPDGNEASSGTEGPGPDGGSSAD